MNPTWIALVCTPTELQNIIFNILQWRKRPTKAKVLKAHESHKGGPAVTELGL